MTALARAPAAARSGVRPASLPSWSSFAPNPNEQVPQLRWPRSIDTYAAMATDPQVAALKRAVALPVRRYRIELDPNGMDPVWAEALADDLDLPVRGSTEQTPGRSPLRFSARRHLVRALSFLDYGHSAFEIAGQIDEQSRWRLTDLQPIPQRTIARPYVDRAGRLERIEQWDTGAGGQTPLPADHLVFYTWGGEPGDPLGESMLRPLWRPYGIKDRALRLDLMKHERNSMGIPVGWVDEHATSRDADAMDDVLAAMAAGEDAYVRLQRGQDFRLRGVEGQTTAPRELAEYCDREMGRALLAMVLHAGQTGAGTLTSAETHDGYLRMFHDVVVDAFCDQLSQQACSRWALWNGIDPVARVVWARDEELDGEPSEPADVAERPASVAAQGRRRASSATRSTRARARRPVAAAAADVPLPDRELRRQPTALEAASGVDFAAVDSDWTAAQETIADLLAGARADLAAGALDAIRGLDEVDPLTLADMLQPVLRQAADELGHDELVEALQAAARDGVDQVVGEMGRQGRTIRPGAVDYDERAQLEAANAVRRLAASLVETATNAALTSAPAGSPGSVVADAVEDAVDRLTDAQPDLAASGMTSRAQNAGRSHAIDTAPYQRVYVSALLDTNTCGPCVDWDGHEFDSLADSEEQFPSGGNKDCEGGDRCRCIRVGVLADEQEAAT